MQSHLYVKVQKKIPPHVREGKTNGPNDASGVVWASSRRRCPLYPSRAVKTYVEPKKNHYLVNKKKRKKLRKTYLEPKQRQTRRLGPFL
jgi:hypothetical protein